MQRGYYGFMNPIEYAVSLLAPHTCLLCGKESMPLCRSCANTLKSSQFIQQTEQSFSLWAFTEYGGAAKELIAQLKFNRAKAAATTVANLMAPDVPLLPYPVMISHIPTAHNRIRTRGYDQAELIARTLAKKLGVPYVASLQRINNARQVGSSRTQRVVQMEHAFVSCKAKCYQGKNVVLIDDVSTTGSTLMAGANALLGAGAKNVRGVVFAYQPK